MTAGCRLESLLKSCEPLAVALSGGTDSSVLLASARRHGVRAISISIETGLNPPGELDAARRLAKRLGIPHFTIRRDMLRIPEVRENAPNRCYVCKRAMMRAVVEEARKRGCAVVADGTHAGDRLEHRPGMAALRELGIRSPFAECSMGREEVERLAAELGIAVRPPSACLATRFPTGDALTHAGLALVGRAEEMLRSEIAGTLRVRCVDRRAIIEADPSQHRRLKRLLNDIRRLGFDDAVIAPAGYRPGGADAWKR